MTTTDIEYEGEPYTVASRLVLEDEVERIASAERELWDPSGDVVLMSTSRFKLLPKREMELLLRQAGFDYEVYGDFELGELTADSHHMVWIASPE